MARPSFMTAWPVLLASAALAAILLAAGWFNPAVYPDLKGYMASAESATPWAEVRHPLYGTMLMALERAGWPRAVVPALNLALHLAAIALLYLAACRFGLSVAAARSLALAALLGQCVMIWGNALLPEMPSASFLLMALAAVLAGVRSGRFAGWAVIYGAALGLSYTLRPIMLPAVAVFPLLFLMLSRMALQRFQLRRAALLLALGFLPFLAQSSYRFAVVGDFNLVSFSGFGVSGMTIQMLTPDVVERLPETHRPFALQLLQIKDGVVAAGNAAPLFRNSSGQRSYMTTALDGFDTFARNYDELTWAPLMPLQRTDETWLAFNARMGAFNGAVLRALPERWLFWVAGASGRLVSRLTVYNVAFLIFSTAFVLVAVANMVRTGTALGGAAGASWSPLALIVAAWVVSTTALSVLTVFPALRYTDTGGLLLSALPIYALFLAVGRRGDSPPSAPDDDRHV